MEQDVLGASGVVPSSSLPIADETPAPVIADLPIMDEAAERVVVASQWRLMRWKFRKHRLALISLVIIIILYIISFFAGFFEPKASDPSNLQSPNYSPPGYTHQAEYVNASPMPIYWIDNGAFSPYVYGYKKTRDPKT